MRTVNILPLIFTACTYFQAEIKLETICSWASWLSPGAPTERWLLRHWQGATHLVLAAADGDVRRDDWRAPLSIQRLQSPPAWAVPEPIGSFSRSC
jgi:hypothetical protein